MFAEHLRTPQQIKARFRRPYIFSSTLRRILSLPTPPHPTMKTKGAVRRGNRELANFTDPYAEDYIDSKPEIVRVQPHQRFAIAYLVTVLCGSFINLLVDSSTHTHYFTRKGNLFNAYFVKYGWAWTSGCFLLFSAFSSTYRSKKKTLASLLRWFLASMYWYIVTQRFFGPPITDRVYILSGGACSLPGIYDSYSCKRKGGLWFGGHDLSGHCLLLIHSSLFLWEELQVLLFDARVYKHIQRSFWQRNVSKFLFSLWGLWWWMLIMTSIYFHNFYETLSGTLCGYGFWFIAYVVIYPNTLFPGTP
ncbi:hypothetical protein K493DRAFT_320972 [Basidiobolus meristosporus CBS 931.73]|uniref:Uncharacterized protein n=1 Tax=Basidiobolus meristosporus CBS 931.73 TaxID=1314790 RepID=A0A1Y1X3I5_9FUNG|nr:hypothetical protein K493DRAFT_320972 [Basidiobolus meristosporus CBS 931.73]|eukprot:ORX79946.1 hypothetical protein K493DRAFT_320972 [Basidiobolus meristosporus CBS 931.73]